MSLLEIKKNLEKRRYNLISILQNGKEDIELSRQHQIYGAIRELENSLRTIEYFQKVEIDNHFDFRLSREQGSNVLQRITLKLMNSKKND